MKLTLGSLFDGLGGWQIAAVRAGVKPIWSSEIEKFPLALTKVRFPNTKQLGDVTKIDGTKIEAPDILTAGSPCQNLSVAGNREGLKGEQSGLFRDSIRLIRQLRMSTGGGQPRFFVWENVPGAFTSGSERGADFRAVLESIAETSIPMPKDGRWANAGMVQCPKCEIAWRVLDAQYWGVPQRRKRIFLVADFAATDRRAAKILFVSKGMSGDSEQGRETRERTASTIEKSTRTASELVHRGGTAVVKIRSGRDDGTAGKGALIGLEQSFTLGCGNDQTLFQERKESVPKTDTVKTKDGIITYNIHKTVKVRKHEVDMDGLKQLLKDSLKSSGLSKKDIAERLNVPQTQVDHYFRQDKYFSIPDAEVWLPLKEMLGITTDEFDEQIMEFEEKECNFDSANRIYDVGGVSPTLTSVDTDKTILQPITLYDMHHAQDVIREYQGVSPSMIARMGTGGNQVPILMENIPESVIMGHDERSARFHTETTDPLTACDYKQPPIVAQMFTTGGQMCWSASKADHMTKFSKNIAGALVATDWKDAPVLVTENKQLEVCAPMTDEDSTDKT